MRLNMNKKFEELRKKIGKPMPKGGMKCAHDGAIDLSCSECRRIFSLSNGKDLEDYDSLGDYREDVL